MLARWLTYLSFICFGLLTLVALYVARKPLCIDSKVVERIDRLGVASTDMVYRCAVNREVKFSSYFNEKARDISQRVLSTERFLESLEPFNHKVQITLLEDRPDLFKVQDHQIFMGQALFNQPGMIEKALAKVWYREKADSFFINQALLEEVVTDFLIYAATSETVASLDIPKWPYMIKSLPEYCESPWRFAEHVAVCRDQNLENVTEYSLRPLLTGTWIRAFQDLSLRERGDFLRNFAAMLRNEHTPALPILGAFDPGVRNSPLLSAVEVVRNMNSYIGTSHVMSSSFTHREFLIYLNQELTKVGFQETFTEAYFDVVLVSETTLSSETPIYQHFKEMANKYPKLHIALKDPSNVWLLPAKFPIPLKSFGQIHAGKTIVEKCGQFDFSFVLGFANMSEKLLVVNACDPKKPPQYSSYLATGAEGFGAENKGVAFVQFHIPSIVMKRSELGHVQNNIYELIQSREIGSPVFQTLGWQELQWNPIAKAYKPKAFIDAIELFR